VTELILRVQRKWIGPGTQLLCEAKHRHRVDRFINRGVSELIGKDCHVICGFNAYLSQALNVRLQPNQSADKGMR
jgi:hypothetical protein